MPNYLYLLNNYFHTKHNSCYFFDYSKEYNTLHIIQYSTTNYITNKIIGKWCYDATLLDISYIDLNLKTHISNPMPYILQEHINDSTYGDFGIEITFNSNNLKKTLIFYTNKPYFYDDCKKCFPNM